MTMVAATPVPAAAAPLAEGRLARQTLAARLAERLSAQMARGERKPGVRLPTEAALAAEPGVSRSVLNPPSR